MWGHGWFGSGWFGPGMYGPAGTFTPTPPLPDSGQKSIPVKVVVSSKRNRGSKGR
jgi:hypothetical protein